MINGEAVKQCRTSLMGVIILSLAVGLGICGEPAPTPVQSKHFKLELKSLRSKTESQATRDEKLILNKCADELENRLPQFLEQFPEKYPILTFDVKQPVYTEGLSPKELSEAAGKPGIFALFLYPKELQSQLSIQMTLKRIPDGPASLELAHIISQWLGGTSAVFDLINIVLTSQTVPDWIRQAIISEPLIFLNEFTEGLNMETIRPEKLSQLNMAQFLALVAEKEPEAVKSAAQPILDYLATLFNIQDAHSAGDGNKTKESQAMLQRLKSQQKEITKLVTKTRSGPHPSAGWESYRSDKFGIALNRPANWTVRELSNAVVFSASPDTLDVYLTIGQPDETFDEVTSRSVLDRSFKPGYQVLASRIGGESAFQVDGSHRRAAASELGRDYYVKKDKDHLIVLTFSVTPSTLWGAYKSVLDEMVASIQWKVSGPISK